MAPRTAPDGFSWHHSDKPGVMQLVPRSQHRNGSIFQKVLHPNRGGGFSQWGK
ncbi:HNH endonuclease [Mesorhizobium sp.]|uniref:HNH endonuclease n=1 Tax=Mesorhizobium sp. TaxID=1871066 RepID=UPI003BA9EFC1